MNLFTFFFEWFKIENIKNHCKNIAWKNIKTRTNFKHLTSCVTFDELLKNFDRMFDENEITKQIKIYNEFYNSKFKIYKNEVFEKFMMRFIIVIIFLNLFDVLLLMTWKNKFIKRLRNDVKHLIDCKSYSIFVDDVKTIDLQHRKKFSYDFLSHERYIDSNSLNIEFKIQLNNQNKCYKCRQSKHRVDDNDALCKNNSWLLKNLNKSTFLFYQI